MLLVRDSLLLHPAPCNSAVRLQSATGIFPKQRSNSDTTQQHPPMQTILIASVDVSVMCNMIRKGNTAAEEHARVVV